MTFVWHFDNFCGRPIVGSHAIAGHSFADMTALVTSGRVDPLKLTTRNVDLAEGAKLLKKMGEFSETAVTMITESS